MRRWSEGMLGGVGLVLVLVLARGVAAQDGSKPPDHQMQAQAHYELAVTYHEQVFESLDKAISEYEKAVKLWPQYAEAHFNLALSYHTKAKLGTDDTVLYRKALAEYKQYLKYSPQGELAAKAKQNIRAVEARLPAEAGSTQRKAGR